MKKGEDIKMMINLRIVLESLYKILEKYGFVKDKMMTIKKLKIEKDTFVK